MKTKLAIMTSVGLAAGLMSGCGSDNGQTTSGSTTPPPASTAQSLDTQQVLAQAKVTSESSAPYTVDNGQLTLTDTSETSDPITVNGM
jgi:PBP1b-binding outer membrane lipoprotein LpoB